MQLTYELMQKDFYEAVIASRNRKFMTKWGLRIIIFVPAFLLVFSVYEAIFDPGFKTSANVLPLTGLLAFWIFIFWGLPWWGSCRQFLKQPAAQGSKTAVLSGDGIHWEGETGVSDAKWKAFLGYLESENLLLLYYSPNAYTVIPKRGLDAAQLTNLRGIICQNVPRMKW